MSVRRSQEGQSVVEFAYVLVPLLLLVVGIFKFGVAWNHKLSLNDAVRASARAASTCRFGGNPVTAFHSVADAAMPGIANPTVTYAAGSCTSGTKVTVTGTYPQDIGIMGVNFGSLSISSSSVATVE